MYLSMPPRTITTPFVLKSSACCSIWPSRAVARSHRMPPVQYIITFLPRSLSRVSSELSHFGNSRLCRSFGSSSSAPPAGGAKWPMADSYALRTSMMTVLGCAIIWWYSIASTCRAELLASDGARSPPSPYATSSVVLRIVSALKPLAASIPSVSLKSVSLKREFHARRASQKARTPNGVPVSEQLSPSRAHRPRPLIACFSAR
mmetsp:Transcript_41579/g.97284  ORF Transcript_41579/g.97284 Transcript_41579/m.97284 type:complete len:204 (-) Transcript_41579:298-909(-)